MCMYTCTSPSLYLHTFTVWSIYIYTNTLNTLFLLRCRPVLSKLKQKNKLSKYKIASDGFRPFKRGPSIYCSATPRDVNTPQCLLSPSPHRRNSVTKHNNLIGKFEEKRMKTLNFRPFPLPCVFALCGVSFHVPPSCFFP